MSTELTLPKGGAFPDNRAMVFERDGAVFANSQSVAEFFGKRHDHVLRDVRDLIEAGCAPNFGETSASVLMPNGGTRNDPSFNMTRDGFTLLAMRFTGKRALRWQILYIDAFNKMEAELRARVAPVAPAFNLRDPAALLALSAELTRELQMSQAAVTALEVRAAEVLEPKAAALDRLAGKNGSENISDTAKALGLRPGRLFDWLAAHRWIFRRHDKAPWRGFQDKLDAGLLDHVESPDRYRPDRSFTTCMVTPKGRARLAELLEREQRSLPAA